MPSFISVIDGKDDCGVPIWMMRQAGRYLPEYRELRAKAGSFLDLCYSPDFASEATLQPIKRFGFDAAILFSDILVVPDALGQTVTFKEGIGPVLDPVDSTDKLQKLSKNRVLKHLEPVLEAVAKVRSSLDARKTLLGFCGAPWTVATYMIAGKSTPDQAPPRTFAYMHPGAMDDLIALLVEASTDYLCAQLNAGADAVQIFDTWGGNLSDEQYARYVVRPTADLVSGVRESIPDARIIGFPKGAGPRLPGYFRETGVSAVGIDWAASRDFVRDEVQPIGPVQGNLDPMALVAGGDALSKGVDAIFDAFGSKPFVFNLGHGIVPHTPIKHVQALVDHVRRRGGAE